MAPRSRSPLPLLAILALAGCVADEPAVEDWTPPPVVRPSPPQITLQGNGPRGTERVSFGDVGGAQTATAELVIGNAGDRPLIVLEPTFTGSQGPLPVLASPWTLELEPGESVPVILSWSPGGDLPLDGWMSMDTNDPVRSQARVPLSGFGRAPRLGVAPQELALDVSFMHCPRTTPLFLSNVGSTPLSVDAVVGELLTDPFGVLETDFVPTTLEPGEALALEVTLTPGVSGPLPGRLVVTSDDPTAPAQEIGVQGEGVALPTVTDSWVQGGSPVDVLVVWDNSGSLSSYAYLNAAAAQIAQELLDGGHDFQLGVVSTDVGDGGQLLGAPTILVPSTPDVVLAFQANSNLGGSGSGIEKGFGNAWLALTPPNMAPGGMNEGFLRPFVPLRILVVTDEMEQSTLPFQTIPDWVVGFQSLVVSPSLVTVSNIAGGLTGCASPEEAASPTPGLVQAAVLSGGVSFPVCASDWADQLLASSWLPTGTQSMFPLSQVPALASMTVLVDGVGQPAGWSFDPALNALVFSSAPPAGALIEVSYGALQECGL